MFGCSSELPPEPGSPGAPTGEAYAYYEGYAPPIDVFNGDEEIYFLDPKIVSVVEGEEVFYVDLDVQHSGPTSYIYKYGYYYNSMNQLWERFEFMDDTVAGSNWIKEDASTTLRLSRDQFLPGENYVVAYSCKKHNREWKCGCESTSNCGMWMLQNFILRNTDFPPEPIPPGSIITVRLWIQPTGDIIELGEEQWIGLDYNTVYDVADEIGGDVDLSLTSPTGTPSEITLSMNGKPYCYENDEHFRCHAYFNTLYTANELGEYTIGFGDEAIPEYVQVETGYFKVKNQGFFVDNLVTYDVGPIDFQNRHGWYSDDGETLYANYDSLTNYGYARISNGYWGEQYFYSRIESGDYNQVTINENVIYMREWTIHTPYYEEYTDRKEAIWMSNNNMIKIKFYGSDFEGFDGLVQEYLNKWPSNEGEEPIDRIEIEPRGDDTIALEAQLDDYAIDLDILYDIEGDGTYDFIGGDEYTNLLIDTCETFTYDADTDKWIVLTTIDGNVGETQVIEITDIDDQDGIDVKDFDGNTVAENKINYSDFDVGNITVQVNTLVEVENKVELLVTSPNCIANRIVTKDNIEIIIHEESVFTIREPDTDGNIGFGDEVNVTAGFNANNEASVTNINGITFTEIDDSDMFEGFTSGLRYVWDKRGPQYDMYAEPRSTTETCTDSDGGLNYYVKGRIDVIKEGNSYFLEDSCAIKDSDYSYTSGINECSGENCGVLEAHCGDTSNGIHFPNNVVNSDYYGCENGCEDGACICDVKSTIIEGETGLYSVEGIEYEISAVVNSQATQVEFTVNGETKSGYSVNDKIVFTDGLELIVLNIIEATAGDTRNLVEFCLNKEAAEEETVICTDSDRGNVSTIQGTTTLTVNGNVVDSHTDSCSGNYLNESYCERIGDSIVIERNIILCKSCSEGACPEESLDLCTIAGGKLIDNLCWFEGDVDQNCVDVCSNKGENVGNCDEAKSSTTSICLGFHPDATTQHQRFGTGAPFYDPTDNTCTPISQGNFSCNVSPWLGKRRFCACNYEQI